MFSNRGHSNSTNQHRRRTAKIPCPLSLCLPTLWNGDAALDLADPISLLSYLFLGGASPTCLQAADVDDNGALEITDAVALLGYLFLGGAAPAEPFSACGVDLTPEPPPGLPCEALAVCP